jgi:tRNA threonylcarbamoyladenosine biosynthesis protein TsaB
VYVSIGPGSYTGLRVGLTVARTLAQAIRTIRCVAVPTVQAVAANASALEFEHLGVVMDAKEQTVYLGVFARRAGRIVPAAQPNLVAVESLPGLLPKPILLIGEALEYCRLTGEGLSIGDESLWPPSAEGVWRVGREMAAAGQFTPYPQLLPLYLRKPEAVRLWEGRRSSAR